MNRDDLNKLLYEISDAEKIYLSNPNSISTTYDKLTTTIVDGKEVLKFILPKLPDEQLIIRRDSRYTFVPFFVHSNININYIYSGECTYLINDEYFTLKKGDLCLFDKDVVRAKMRTDTNDIVINISLSNAFFSEGVIGNIGDQSIIIDFILNALSKSNTHDNFMIFRNNNNDTIIMLFEKLLIEYYSRNVFFKEIINSYLNVIFMEQFRSYQNNPKNHFIYFSKSGKGLNILSILHYIDQNYIDCTLNEMSNHFGYNSKYLSTFITETTGKTFKQLQLEKRLTTARLYLSNTNLSIEQISQKVGIKNLTFFYKKFEEYVKMSPNDYRNQ